MPSLLEEPTLIGRERELALIAGLLAQGEERGDALLLHGEPGIGKSALAGVAVDQARARGATVLTTTGVPSEADLPFSCLHQLVWPVQDQIDALPDGQRTALRGALGGGDAPVDAYRAGLAVLGLLGDVADRAPVVVVVEDAHWLDDATCDVLAFVARRIEMDAVALLVTSRDTIPQSLLGASLRTHRLEPLTAAASDALLRALDPTATASTRRQVLEQAAGNPLGLVELLSEAARGGEDPALPSWLPLTTRLERAFAARVAELPPATRAALLVAALTEQVDVREILDAAAGVAGAPLTLESFTPAIDAGLVEVDELRVRFGHPLMRSAIAQGGTAAARQAAHAALAATLAHDPARAIWHRVAAAGGTDDALAGELAALAEQAVQRSSPITAAETLGRAATLTDDPARRGARLLDAAELALEAGRQDLLERVLADARALALDPADEPRRRWLEQTAGHRAPAPAWLAAYLDRAEHLLAAGDFVRGTQALLTVAFRAWWADVPDELRGRLLAAAATLPAPAQIVETIVLATVDPEASGLEVAARLEQLDLDATPTQLLRMAALAGPIVGAFERGAVVAQRAVDRLRARGRYGLLAPALVARAWSGVMVGDWSTSLAAARDAGTVSRETDQPLWLVSATAAEASLTALRGAPDEGLALADRAQELLVPGEADGMRSLIELARGLAHLCADRPAEALAHLERLRDEREPWHAGFVARWSIADAAEAAHRAGDRAALDAAIAWAAARERPSDHLRGSLAYARLLADTGDGDCGPDPDGTAQDALLACADLPALRARVQLAYGARLRREHRSGDARAVLRAARDTLEALGMGPPAERVRQELRAAGEAVARAPVDAAELLSPHELQIARMAAEGRTNREIGATLYLSHRTVGSHLYRIFPKLGIASRAELPAVLGTPG